MILRYAYALAKKFPFRSSLIGRIIYVRFENENEKCYRELNENENKKPCQTPYSN